MEKKNTTESSKRGPTILLINPATDDTRRNSLPLGLLYILSALRKNGNKVFLLDFANHIGDLSMMDNLLLYTEIDVVGISTCTSVYPAVLKLAERIKTISPNTKIVLGGPHASWDYHVILATQKQIDAVSIGPGEETWVAIANAFAMGEQCVPFTEVSNVAWRDEQNIIHIGEYQSRNFDNLESPDFSDYVGFEGIPSLCTTRGCVFQCNFCALNTEKIPRWHAIKRETVACDLQNLDKNFSLRHLYIADADFLVSQKHAEQVFSELKKYESIEHLHFSTRVDSVLRSRSIIEAMNKQFCLYIELGVESGSLTQLVRYGKRTTPDQIKDAVQFLKSVKGNRVSIQPDLIPFDPFVSPSELKETAKLLRDLRLNQAQNEAGIFTKMHILPGTEMRDRCIKEGIILQNDVVLPCWNFQNEISGQIYAYLMQYKRLVMPKLEKAREKVKQALGETTNIMYWKTAKRLSEYSYMFFEQLLESDGSYQLMRQLLEKCISEIDEINERY